MRPPAPDLPGKREEPIDVFGLIDASIFHFEMKRIRRGREPQVDRRSTLLELPRVPLQISSVGAFEKTRLNRMLTEFGLADSQLERSKSPESNTL